MNRTPGVVLGVVGSVTDPENQGRIQVKFPWIDDQIVTKWASIATPMAGGGRGMFFMPEEEDECLVAFDQGCFDHPYIVGFLWNGVDTPPNDDIDIRVRRFQSVSGHVLEFNDNDGSQEIRLRSQAGHELHFDDSDPELVTLTTAGGHQILLKDKSGSVAVKVVSAGGHEVVLDDTAATLTLADSNGNTVELAASGITIAAALGGSVDIEADTINVNGGAVNITATGQLSATGTPIHLNP